MVDRRRVAILLIVAMVCSVCPVAGQTGEQKPFSSERFTLRLLDLRINSVCQEQVARLLEDDEGETYARRQTLQAWGLMVPEDPQVRHGGQEYYPVSALPGVTAHIDEARQELVLATTAANCFPAFELDVTTAGHALPQSPASGGFFNYDLLHQGGDSGERNSAMLELGFYNRLGLGIATALSREEADETTTVRLDTAWRHDWPGRMRTLTLGDTLSRSGSWGRTVRYGGVQWGTNFTTRPGFITHPLPRISGEAVVPTTVELYTNNMRRLQGRLPPGPFTLREIPAVAGMNEVTLITEDLLGREQVIRQPFYVSRALLKKGLHDYTYEAGAIRRNYARRSNDYGRPFAAATHRFGVSERLTGEVRAEVLEAHRTVGIGAAWLPAPRLGTLSGAVAVSSGDAGEGMLYSAGMERKGRDWSYGMRATWSERNFRQLGLAEGEPAPARVVTAGLGRRLGGSASLALNYSELARRGGTDNRLVNASVSARLGGRLALRGSLLRDLDSGEQTLGLTLSLPLGNRTSASASHQQEETGHGSRLQLQRNPPRGTGFGYRLSTEANHNRRDRHQAALQARSDYGNYRAEVVRLGDEVDYRLNARGGIAFLGGELFVSRPIDGSFGVVRVGDYPGVRVYHENHLIDRTNARGTAFLPDLRPFEKNRIRIAADDLPLAARIDQLETVAVPGYRQGALVRFAAQPARGALITIVREDGQPLPAGATVRMVGEDRYFPVARYGQAWVTGLEPGAEAVLEAQWADRRCTFTVTLPGEAGPVPRLGPVICRELP